VKRPPAEPNRGGIGPSTDGADRGQSETIGFVFVFSLIVLMIGVVYVGGFPVLEDARDAERVNNMERAFEVLDDNINDVTRNGAPSRATEMKLSGGRLSVAEGTTVDIYVEEAGNESNNATYSATTRPIVYSDGGTTFALSFGAVLRQDGDSAVMLSDPDWLLADDRTVIPFIITAKGEGSTSVGGDVTALVVARGRTPGVEGSFAPENSSANVTVTVSSERADAWNRYMSDQGMNAIDDDPSDGEVTYRFETEALYVPRKVIDVEFST